MKFHDTIDAMKAAKFATQMDAKVLKELREFAKESGRSISNLVSEAVAEYLNKSRMRPAFRSAMNEIVDEHAELLQRLAK